MQLLVDEVADVGKDALTQFDAQQPRTDWGAEVLFKTLEDGIRQIRLPPQQSQQRRAIGWALVVPG